MRPLNRGSREHCYHLTLNHYQSDSEVASPGESFGSRLVRRDDPASVKRQSVIDSLLKHSLKAPYLELERTSDSTAGDKRKIDAAPKPGNLIRQAGSCSKAARDHQPPYESREQGGLTRVVHDETAEIS
jgi:hypothetical protein